MQIWFAFGLLVATAAVVIVFVVRQARKRRMSAAAKRTVVLAVENALKQSDAVRRVLAMDAVLDLTLTQLGFSGSLGEKLKKAGPRIPTIQAVWEAHKLRNRLAHEHDATVHPAEADRAVRVLEHAVRRFLS